jgi:16S rRNA (guanine527-N7)-methyltransferase
VTTDPAGAAALRRVLLEARDIGLVGNDDPARHLEHAAVFAAAAESVFGTGGPGAFLDLGTGAGLPGLALASRWTGTRAVFLDAAQRRCGFVEHAIERLGPEFRSRCTVVCGRAEELAHRPDLRESVPLVVARSFAAPAVTAELGAPFLARDGALIVSEPPSAEPGRWSEAGLALLGLAPSAPFRAGGFGVVIIRRASPCPERYPRRTGIPAKRPLW